MSDARSPASQHADGAVSAVPGPLAGHHVLLGVGGSIAAYRAADLIRRLRELGATVRVAPTKAATAFVTPLLLETLSGAPVLGNVLDVDNGRIPHVEEAYRATVAVVAPATADLLARMAHGFADEALLATLLSFRGPLVVAPAMETHMWEHPAVQANVALLVSRGALLVEPTSGALASGRSGAGRLVPVDTILERVLAAVAPKDLVGRTALVTAGPTAEPIDPVRTLTNRSSGKMGVAVARALAQRGATVHLVHGPLKIAVPQLPGLIAHPVQTAAQMHTAVLAHVDAARGALHTVVMVAAVADATPAHVATQKLKKTAGQLDSIALTPTRDILGELGARKHAGTLRTVLVGFAAETENVVAHAQEKLARKHCDLICANDVSAPDNGFDGDLNTLHLVAPTATRTLPHTTKDRAAHGVVDAIAELIRRTFP